MKIKDLIEGIEEGRLQAFLVVRHVDHGPPEGISKEDILPNDICQTVIEELKCLVSD